MKWFNRLVWRLSRNAWDQHEEFMEEERNQARTTLRQARLSRGTNTVWPTEEVRENDQLRATSMHFKLYNCVGGHILETSCYNSRTDNNEHTLYMIHQEEDFAKQIAQAIMLEQMKL